MTENFTIQQFCPMQFLHSSESLTMQTSGEKLKENLLLLLREQFESEKRFDENVNCHFDSFLENCKSTGMTSNTFWVLVAETENVREPCGFTCLVLLPKLNSKNGYLYVDELFVREKFRRCGIASKLLEESKKIANNLNLAGVRLLVRNENISAQTLYEKAGFSISDTKFGQYLPSKDC